METFDVEPKVRRNPEGLPHVLDLIPVVVEDVRDHFLPFLSAGAGRWLLVTPLFTGVILALYAGVIIASMNEDVVWMVASLGGGYVLLFALGLAFVPLYASIGRAVWAHIADGTPLTLSAAYSTYGVDLGKVLGLHLMWTVLAVVGFTLFIVPAVLVSLFGGFAWPALLVHRMGPIEAFAWSSRHVLAHFGWHLGYWGLGLLISMVLSQLPIVGAMLLPPVMLSYQLRAYRLVFEEAELHQNGSASPD